MYIIRNQTSFHGNLTVDGAIESYRMCLCNETVTPSTASQDKVELGAFMYIGVVVGLYALSITCLLIRYARTYEEEKDFKYHYSEFVNRDRFQALTYRNKLALERTKMHLDNIQNGNESISRSRQDLKQKAQCDEESNAQWCPNGTSGLTCPVITITNCCDASKNGLVDSVVRVECDPETHGNTACEGLRENTTRVNGINCSSDNYGSTPYGGLRSNLLMVPLSEYYQPYDMTVSYDTEVGYIDNHVVDVPERERNGETGTEHSSSELERVKIIIGDDTD